ncbi:podoplanin isoform X2 [Enoplosus armatus]|uniref:podoplanin isoform X2 n=1 Tax=Enoplosus armatus TaxID=215367 RepID=UPI00399646CB
MNVQLLLLLALVGPFSAFTHASPTEIPADLDVGITETVADVAPDATNAPKEDHAVVTGPPATEPAAAPEEVATEVVTEAAPPSYTVNTEEPVVDTEAPAAVATAAPEPLITLPPAVETAVPTEKADAEVITEATGATEAEAGDKVVVEDDTDEGLSSGQVVGIVIGALLAVIIVIAVVIAVVRRMGKYSP